MTPDTVAPLQRRGEDDPYLLRGLLWCDLCTQLMVPVLAPTAVRHYGCTSEQCLRPFVPAEQIETLVWEHVARLNEAAAAGVAPHQRRHAIRPLLRQVRVGGDTSELWYEWQ